MAGSKLTLRFGAFSSSSVSRSSSGGLLAGLEGQGDALLGGHLAGLGQGVEHRRAAGVADLGQEAGVEHQVGQAQRDGPVEGPGEPIEPLGAVGGVAEAAGGLDRLGGGVVLAGEPEHGAGEGQARGPGGLGHGVALGPARVVGVAAGDLGRVDAQVAEQALQLVDAGDLEAPGADAEGQGGRVGRSRAGTRRHLRVGVGMRRRLGRLAPDDSLRPRPVGRRELFAVDGRGRLGWAG